MGLGLCPSCPQDGSCNGLQHYAALGRDSVGAASVNLLPSELPQDVYSGVAAQVRERANPASLPCTKGGGAGSTLPTHTERLPAPAARWRCSADRTRSRACGWPRRWTAS